MPYISFSKHFNSNLTLDLDLSPITSFILLSLFHKILYAPKVFNLYYQMLCTVHVQLGGFDHFIDCGKAMTDLQSLAYGIHYTYKPNLHLYGWMMGGVPDKPRALSEILTPRVSTNLMLHTN